jgi:hypothetical protein
MNVITVKDAFTILEMNYDAQKRYTLCDINKQYKKLALKYHPDKSDFHNTSKFQAICQAKEFVITNLHNINSSLDSYENEQEYEFILSEIDTLRIMYNVLYKGVFTYRVKKKVSSNHTLQNYMANFVLDNMLRLIEKKIKDNELKNTNVKIILLRPTLVDLLNDNVFIYRNNTSDLVYYIPLWHKEVSFYDELTKIEYIFICIPNFSNIQKEYPIISHVCIDDSNNLFIHIAEFVSQLQIETKIFAFNTTTILETNQHTFLNQGVCQPHNDKNIYDTTNRSNVFIRIQ